MRRIVPIFILLLVATLSGCSTEPKESGYTTLSVMLDHDATAAQKSAVEQRLRGMPSVTNVAFETRGQAYEKLKNESPELLAGLDPEDLPESFHGTVTDASVAEAVELVMATIDGVAGTAIKIADVDPVPKRIGAIVRLEPTATQGQRATVERAVRAIPNAQSVEFEDRDAAYERLRKQCQGKGDLATQLKSAATRASFRLQLPVKRGAASGLTEIQRLDGVDAVLLVPAAML